MLKKLSETRIARWLVRHRPLWDLLWGLSTCAVAFVVVTWPTDRMMAIGIGLALVWLVEQSLVLRAIRRQRVHSCETGISVRGGPTEEETREAVQRAIEELTGRVYQGRRDDDAATADACGLAAKGDTGDETLHDRD